MPVNEVLLTLATVAEALDYAHQQGVVHRDIKPANIMITKDRVVKVMDFGIAKMASSSKTQTNMVLGTPTYMSPEQIAGKKVDGRSDIFSLGVVLFELLTGQPPFTADNLSALLFSIAHHPHPDIQTLGPSFRRWSRRSWIARFRKSCRTAIVARKNSRGNSGPVCRASQPEGGVVWRSKDCIPPNPIPASNVPITRIASWRILARALCRL